MYEKYITYRYTLKIDGKDIPETSEQRLDIQQIQTNTRRQGLSSLTILFSDPMLKWRNLFTVNKPIKVEFTGTNFDGSAPEKFEGYVSQINPSTQKNYYDLEVMCLSAPPTLTNTQKKSTSYKKMSRKQVVDKIAKIYGAKVNWYNSTELNVVEDELVLSTNTSHIEFMSQILEDVGSRICLLSLKEWIVSPIFSANTKPIGGTYSNQNGETTLLDFEPTFSKYSYEEDETGSSDGKDKQKTAIDPDTKSANESSDSSKPNNNPESKSSGGGSSGSSGNGNMYYDPKTGQWKKA